MDTGKFDIRIRKKWDELEPDKKKKVIIFSIIGLFIFLGLVAYQIRTPAVPEKEEEAKKKEISLEPRLLEKSQYNEMQKRFKELGDEVTAIKKEKEQLQNQAETATPEVAKIPVDPPAPSSVKEQQRSVAISSPSGTAVPPPGYPPEPPGWNAGAEKTIETIGDIEIVSQRIESGKDDKKSDKDKKKESMKIYLPPSFMEATLLSGMDAPTGEGAQGQPAPVIVRIKDLAVLPNKVKANLKGCFLIAEGYGNLSDERAHLRLTNLSCLSKKGQAVIDQKIKGFVVDSDGKIGLRGHVVAKFGSKIAMSMLAGLFGGAGDALRTSATTTSISALGSTQVIDTDDLVRASIGGSLSQAAKDLQKFYLDLGKQSLPVVEVGAMKNITVVISEGVALEVRERENACIGGRQCEK